MDYSNAAVRYAKKDPSEVTSMLRNKAIDHEHNIVENTWEKKLLERKICGEKKAKLYNRLRANSVDIIIGIESI